jgi:GNAT superfamily N-acetyltransferase
MPFVVTPATLNDAGSIVHHRRAMFSDMGYRDTIALDAMSAAFHPWLNARMEAGDYVAWMARTAAGEIAGGLGLWLMDWPPHMIGAGARGGNILNVYTEPEFRRLGVARALMQAALDWCRANGIKAVILHASMDGRALYESIGFQPTNEMRIAL